jgi:hypothetical protein
MVMAGDDKKQTGGRVHQENEVKPVGKSIERWPIVKRGCFRK